MTNRARKLRLAATLLFFVLFSAPCQRRATSSWPLEDEVFEEVNGWRHRQGLRELERTPQLDSAAERRASDIAARPRDGRLSGRGDLTEFLKRAGVSYVARATEYLQTQRGYNDPVTYAIERWRNDPEAKRMALDPDWDAIGIGTARADDGTLVIASIFVQRVSSRIDLAELERRIEEMVNEARRRERLPPLAHSDALADVARAHSRDMARNHSMGHEDARGHGPDWRVRQSGIRYRKLAENVAENQGWEDPARRAVEGWLQSPGHRHNIMERELEQTGVGVALDAESGTYYFTQLFLQPPSSARRQSR